MDKEIYPLSEEKKYCIFNLHMISYYYNESVNVFIKLKKKNDYSY